MTILATQFADTRDAPLERLLPAPVPYFDWLESEQLDFALKQVLLRRREMPSGVVNKNSGGWQSACSVGRSRRCGGLQTRILSFVKEYVERQIGRGDPASEYECEIRASTNANEHWPNVRTHDNPGRHSFFSCVHLVARRGA